MRPFDADNTKREFLDKRNSNKLASILCNFTLKSISKCVCSDDIVEHHRGHSIIKQKRLQ